MKVELSKISENLTSRGSEVYLEPSQRSVMELFYENI